MIHGFHNESVMSKNNRYLPRALKTLRQGTATGQVTRAARSSYCPQLRSLRNLDMRSFFKLAF